MKGEAGGEGKERERRERGGVRGWLCDAPCHLSMALPAMSTQASASCTQVEPPGWSDLARLTGSLCLLSRAPSWQPQALPPSNLLAPCSHLEALAGVSAHNLLFD